MKKSHGFLALFIVVMIILFLQGTVLEQLLNGSINNGNKFLRNDTQVTLTRLSSLTISLHHMSVKHSKLYSSSLLVYSAIASNSTNNTAWDIVAVQGWINQEGTNRFGCCVLYGSGGLELHYNVQIYHWYAFREVKYGALQLQCRLENQGLGIPKKVQIIDVGSNSNHTCDEDITKYLTIEFAFRRAAIVIFLKVLYAQLSYLDLLAWFEIHKLLGVDKVVAYVTDTLNQKARVVLGHYQRTGLFEALHYPIPFQDQESVLRSDTPVSWNYRGVSMFDGQVRLGGYDYLVSIDPDEYLLPTRTDQSLRVTFNKIFKEKPNAAGFLFKTYLFVKDWGGINNSSFSSESYLYRTEPTRDRVKHVVIPNRVQLGKLLTHTFKPKPRYKRYVADTNDIAVYHFRACRDKQKGTRPMPCDNVIRIKDSKVFNMFNIVKAKIEIIRKLYGL